MIRSMSPVNVRASDAGANEIDEWHLRFFDEVLKDEPQGVFAHRCRVFVLGEGWRDLPRR